MTARRSLGFEASAMSRAGLGAAFIAAATVLVWVIERPAPAAANARPAPAAATAASWPVSIESTFPVATWSVSILGVEQVAAHQDGFSWSGTVAAPAGEELLIQARAADDHAPHHGLRLLVGAAGERVVWGAGDVTATATVGP